MVALTASFGRHARTNHSVAVRRERFHERPLLVRSIMKLVSKGTPGWSVQHRWNDTSGNFIACCSGL